jgi:hypothetical protein
VARYWFKPKRFGFGAVPSTWQGWALGVVYVVALVAVSIALVPLGGTLTAGAVVAWSLIVIAGTAAVIVIAYYKTDGPWRWRWSKRRSSAAR